MDVLTFFHQKSAQKSKENIIEINDSEESASDDEGKKRKKKRAKGSKVSKCAIKLSGVTVEQYFSDSKCQADTPRQ